MVAYVHVYEHVIIVILNMLHYVMYQRYLQHTKNTLRCVTE